jgi:hypothetical protein
MRIRRLDKTQRKINERLRSFKSLKVFSIWVDVVFYFKGVRYVW